MKPFDFYRRKLKQKLNDKCGGILIVSHCGSRLGNNSFPSLKSTLRDMEMLYRDNYSSKCLADVIASLTSNIGALHASHIRFVSYK